MRRLSCAGWCPSRLLYAVALLQFLAAGPARAATFTIINLDGVGEGLNDTSARAPVGGNSGTTLGEQRLIALQQAAATWGALLGSSVDIRVQVGFNPLTCGGSSAILGSAGALGAVANFAGAPFADTWYHSALANALAGTDLDPAANDINASITSAVDTGCLGGISGFYYGLDANVPAGTIDIMPVLLHELGHGLGFSTFVNLSSGAKSAGFDDPYMRNLEDHSTGKLWPVMTNAERAASARDTGDLHFVGSNVVAGSAFLSAGRTAGGHVRIYAPATLTSGSSVSHFDTLLTPNELMEPSINNDALSILAAKAMYDLGWPLPAPTATATISPTSTLTTTATITATASLTATITLTPMPTSTPTLTRSPTTSPTRTPTSTPSSTFTATSSPTQTATNTPTRTSTQTPTSTITPTITPSVTATETPTATATDTPSPTETTTPTVTPSSTPTSTATAVGGGIASGAGLPGGYACIVATLAAGGQPVAALSTTIADPSSSFVASGCVIHPAIGPNSANASSLTHTAVPGAEVVSIAGGSGVIPDGTLYTCAFVIPPATAVGDYPLDYTLQALDGLATPLPSAVTGTAIRVAGCAGDCDGDGVVAIAELSRIIHLFLGGAFPCDVANPDASCPAADANLNGTVALSEVAQATNHLINGCPP